MERKKKQLCKYQENCDHFKADDCNFYHMCPYQLRCKSYKKKSYLCKYDHYCPYKEQCHSFKNSNYYCQYFHENKEISKNSEQQYQQNEKEEEEKKIKFDINDYPDEVEQQSQQNSNQQPKLQEEQSYEQILNQQDQLFQIPFKPPKQYEQKRRIGIDIGGVIMYINKDKQNSGGGEDTIFGKDYLKSKGNEGYIEAIKILIAEFGKENVFILSKCGSNVEKKSREWLDHTEFFEKTGFDNSNLLFCKERSEKASICKNYKINIFIDDRMDVLQYMKNEDVSLKILFGNTEESFKMVFNQQKGNIKNHFLKFANDWKGVLELLKIDKIKQGEQNNNQVQQQQQQQYQQQQQQQQLIIKDNNFPSLN